MFSPHVGKIPWRRKWQPTPVFLPGEFHEQRSLVGLQSMRSWVRHDWVTNTSWFKEGQNGNIGPCKEHDEAGFGGQLDPGASARQDSLSFIPVFPWVELDFSLFSLNTAETWLPAALDWLPQFKKIIPKEVLWLANIDGHLTSGPMTVFRGLGFNDYSILCVWGWRKNKGWSM